MAEGNSIYADVSTFPKASATPYDPLGTIGKLQGLEQQRIGIDQSKLKLINEKWDYSSKVLGTLLNKPDLNSDDVVKAHKQLLEQGIQTPEQFAQEVSQIPTLEGVKRQYPNASPEQQQQILSQKYKDLTSSHLMRGATVVENLNHAYGSNPQIQDVGGGYQAIQNYRGGTRATSPVVPYGLPRTNPGFVEGEKGQPGYNAPIGINTPNSPGLPFGGAPATLQQRSPVQRLPVENPPGSPTSPRPVQTVQPPPTQRPPVPQVGEAGSNAERVATGHAQFAQPRPGTPPMGLEGAIESGQKQYATATEQAGRTLQAIKPAQQALKLMDPEVIKGLTGTGPIAGKLTGIVSALQGIGIVSKGMDAVAQRQELVKYLAQYLKNSPSAQRSDSAQALADKANANPDVQNLKALVEITRNNIALDRVDAAKALAFQRGEKNKRYNEFAEHQANFPNTIDQRAFKLDAMSDKERNEFLDHIEKESPANRKKFKESYNLAKELGMM